MVVHVAQAGVRVRVEQGRARVIVEKSATSRFVTLVRRFELRLVLCVFIVPSAGCVVVTPVDETRIHRRGDVVVPARGHTQRVLHVRDERGVLRLGHGFTASGLHVKQVIHVTGIRISANKRACDLQAKGTYSNRQRS